MRIGVVSIMNMDIKLEKVIEALYVEIADRITDEICITCPIVRCIRDLKDTIKNANHEVIIHELGLSFGNMEFPCMKD